MLKDKDTLVFKSSSGHRMAYLVGALLLAMAISGGVFAYGFTNASVTLTATSSTYNFADVSANTSSTPSWTFRGMEKGHTGSGSLFDIDTLSSGYPGDLSVTVVMANVDQLVSVYRNLLLALEVRDSTDTRVDINGDGLVDDSDVILLTLQNGSVTFNIEQTTASRYTVMLSKGSFICNPARSTWTVADGAPQLYCELAQR
jgi:hypothetical protein